MIIFRFQAGTLARGNPAFRYPCRKFPGKGISRSAYFLPVRRRDLLDGIETVPGATAVIAGTTQSGDRRGVSAPFAGDGSRSTPRPAFEPVQHPAYGLDQQSECVGLGLLVDGLGLADQFQTGLKVNDIGLQRGNAQPVPRTLSRHLVAAAVICCRGLARVRTVAVGGPQSRRLRP